MPLEQTLTEIEPIFRGTDDTFQFTHPSFQEVLTAKQFADEINSGELSVRDAYVHYWSYEEDADLWDLPKDREWRALLPGWKRVLEFIATFLNNEHLDQLVTVVCSGHDATYVPFFHEGFNYDIPSLKELASVKELYDPFESDYDFSFVLASKNREVQRRVGNDLMNKLLNEHYPFPGILKYHRTGFRWTEEESCRVIKRREGQVDLKNIKRMGSLRYYDRRLLPFLDIFTGSRYCDRYLNIKGAVLDTLRKSGHFDPKLIDLLEEESTWYSICNMDRDMRPIDPNESSMKEYDPGIVVLLDDHPELCEIIGNVCEKIRQYSKEFMERKGPEIRAKIKKWGDLGAKSDAEFRNRKYDPVMLRKQLDTKYPEKKSKAAMTLAEHGEYDPRFLDLFKEESSHIKWSGIYALERSGKYHPILHDLLCSTDERLRVSAAEALVKLGRFSNYELIKMYLYESKNNKEYISRIAHAHNQIKPQGYNPPEKKLVA